MASTGEPFGLFWDSQSGDRTYSSESFERWLKKFFTTGVFNGDLQVSASSGMTLSIAPGYANVDGKVRFWDNAFTLTLEASNSTYPRIDTIVITRDNVNRQITCEVVKGAYAGNNPQPTAPIRNAEKYQIVLAQIYIEHGVTAITQSDITDTRPDTDLCGYITGTVEELDFSAFTAQFEAYFAEFKEGNEEDFDAWFQEMKDQLSTDAAGHLQLEIDEHTSQMQTLETQVSAKAEQSLLAPIQTTLVASKAYVIGEQFVYQGLLYKATAAITQGGTITINGNCELSDDVTDQIYNLYKSIYKDYSTATFKYRSTAGTNASYTITEDGLYKIETQIGATSATNNIVNMNVNAIPVMYTLSLAYNVTSCVLYLKKGAQISSRNVTSSTVTVVYKID